MFLKNYGNKLEIIFTPIKHTQELLERQEEDVRRTRENLGLIEEHGHIKYGAQRNDDGELTSLKVLTTRKSKKNLTTLQLREIQRLEKKRWRVARRKAQPKPTLLSPKLRECEVDTVSRAKSAHMLLTLEACYERDSHSVMAALQAFPPEDILNDKKSDD